MISFFKRKEYEIFIYTKNSLIQIENVKISLFGTFGQTFLDILFEHSLYGTQDPPQCYWALWDCQFIYLFKELIKHSSTYMEQMQQRITVR